MQQPTKILLLAAFGALAVYLSYRTKRGQVVVSDVIGEVIVSAKKIGDTVSETAGAAVNALMPRGIRNNNPGNIDYLPPPRLNWQGTIGSDGRFAIFDTAANGVRAIGRELRASISKGQTIEQAIHEWAPPVENETGRYVAIVAAAVGARPADRLTVEMLPAAALAIIKHENVQQPYDPDAVAQWVYA